MADRPGHDRRYAIDNAKLRELGFSPIHQFAQALELTVDWYLDNPEWCRQVTSGEYQSYYQRMYGDR